MDTPETRSNLFGFILCQHGRDVLRRLREVEKITIKLAKWRNHRNFDLRCKHNNITPSNLRIKSSVKGIKAHDILHKTARKLLDIRIAQSIYTIKKLEDRKKQIENELCDAMEQDKMAEVRKHISRAYEYNFVKAKQQQMDKYERLERQQEIQLDENEDTTIDRNRWVMNLSSRNITNSENSVLQKGLNFAITPTKMPLHEIISSTELACSLMNNQNNASRLRSDVARILEQCKPPKPNITKEERQALYKLKKDDSIKILPADKGRVTVIMNSEEYDKQIMKLLQDNNTYEKLRSDPTKKYKAKLVNSLKKWKNENKLSYSEYNRLYPTSECHPKFYG